MITEYTQIPVWRLISALSYTTIVVLCMFNPEGWNLVFQVGHSGGLHDDAPVTNGQSQAVHREHRGTGSGRQGVGTGKTPAHLLWFISFTITINHYSYHLHQYISLLISFNIFHYWYLSLSTIIQRGYATHTFCQLLAFCFCSFILHFHLFCQT